MMFKSSRRIVFDLGGVLYSNGLPYIYNSMKRNGVNKKILKNLLFSELHDNLKRGSISDREYWNNFSNHIDISNTKSLFNKSYKINFNMLQYIYYLKSINLKVDLCSDISENMYKFMNYNYFLDNLFDRKILSYKNGCLKKDNEILDYLLLDKYPEDIIIVQGKCSESKIFKSKKINIINFDGNINNLILDLNSTY